MLPDSDSDGGSENADQPDDIDTFIPASCPDDITSYITQFMMLDRSNVHAPNILYQLPSIKFFYSKYAIWIYTMHSIFSFPPSSLATFVVYVFYIIIYR